MQLCKEDYSKQYAATTAAHSEKIIEMLKISKCLGYGHIIIWDNIYVCDEHYNCATASYLLYILLKSYSRIIDRGISAPINVRDVVYGLNDTDKMFIFHLMATVQLTGSKRFDTQIAVHTATQSTDMNLSLEFQKYLSNASLKHGIIDHVQHLKTFK